MALTLLLEVSGPLLVLVELFAHLHDPVWADLVRSFQIGVNSATNFTEPLLVFLVVPNIAKKARIDDRVSQVAS